MSEEYDSKAEEVIPADVRMMSGCHDDQTSADVGNVGSFDLPDPAGRAGGACTSALLKVLYDENQAPEETPSFVDVFLRTREVLEEMGFSQIPQLSSSRRLDIQQPFSVSDEDHEGTRHAVLIGINYVGQRGELSGCHNDVHNIKDYLMNVHGFEEDNMTVLLDDGEHEEPTRDNIMGALDELVNKCEEGDTAFVHYSGHGGRVKDESGVEENGYDETLIPVDFQSAGQILDNDLYEHLACALPAGVICTCLMDACHSGTVMDLPYNYVADGEHEEEMGENTNFNIESLLGRIRNAMDEAGIDSIDELLDNREKRRDFRRAIVREKVGERIMGRLFR